MKYFNTRQFDDALNLIDSIVIKDPENLDANRLGMLVGTSKDDFTTIIYHADAILDQDSNDAQALYMKSIYNKATGLPGYEGLYVKMSKKKP